MIVFSGTITAPLSASFSMRFNSDTASNYSDTNIYGTGSAAGSYRDTSSTNIRIGAVNNGTGAQSNFMIHVMNYANTTTYKTALARFNDAGAETAGIVGTWRNTSAITSITFLLASTSTYATGSTFTLYGIAAA